MSSGNAQTVGLSPVFGAFSNNSYIRGLPLLCPLDSTGNVVVPSRCDGRHRGLGRLMVHPLRHVCNGKLSKGLARRALDRPLVHRRAMPSSQNFPVVAIGVVHAARTETERTPVQSSLNRDEHATVEIFEQYERGLLGLEGFDHAWLMCWLDRPRDQVGETPMVQVPFLLGPSQRKVGIFATRGPRRPNPLGLSLVRVIEISGRTVRFAGVDMVDGTPVIDLKPYVTRFDRPLDEPRCGWFDTVDILDGTTPADLSSRAGPIGN